MYHAVTQRLAIAGAPSPNPTQEFTRAAALEANNAVSFEYWLISTDGTVSVKVFLEGSNDLCNWVYINDSTSGTVPGYTHVALTGVLPWAYVRLRYEVTSASSDQVFIRAGIEATRTA
jgi:hypothetical protein